MRRFTVIARLQVVGIALAVVVSVIAFGSTQAAAQGFNVFAFQCVSGGDVKVDVRGLGHTNLCLDGTINVDADCACVNNGGNCPVDAKKQAEQTTLSFSQILEPKNGRVNETVDVELGGAVCDDLESQCGGGQTARAITQTIDANWTLCATTATSGACSCAGQTALGTLTNGACDASTIEFAGKRNSCLNLF